MAREGMPPHDGKRKDNDLLKPKKEKRARIGRIIRVKEPSPKEEEKDLGKEGSLLYRIWQKSREMLAKKEGGKEITEEAGAAAFYQEASVEKGTTPAWLQEQIPQDPLKELWHKWGKGDVYAPESFLTGETPPELQRFWDLVRRTAHMILLGDQADVDEENFDKATILLRSSQDYMVEWMFLFPPENGQDVQPEEIAVALDESRVKFGVDWDLAQRVVNEHLYFKMLPIAKGQAPVNGTDGVLIECYSRESTLDLKERQDGTVDYRSSGSLQLIHPGDVICRLEPPGESIDGVNVRGAKVPAKPGKPAHFPRIKNTVISPEGDELRSTVSGHIYFENDRFVVENLLVIDGDVNGTVGNINYDGDIRIQGDICEGFSVKATQNITVAGMISNAQVIAGGDILVGGGVNGNGTGYLEAKGKIRSKFLENCRAVSGGDIMAESIIWSDLFCKGKITVTSGRGIIIGGTVVALESITAKVIGNFSRRPIDITLGCPPEILEKRDQLEAELTVVQKELTALLKDLEFLKGKSGDPRRDKQYNELRLKKPLLQMQERRLTAQLNEAYETISAAKGGTMRCETLYPPAHIFIGAGIQTVNEVHHNCLVYGTAGKVVIGSL